MDMAELEGKGTNKLGEKARAAALGAGIALGGIAVGAVGEHQRMVNHLDASVQRNDTIGMPKVPQSAIDFVDSTNALFAGTEGLLPKELVEKVDAEVRKYEKEQLDIATARQTADGDSFKGVHPLSDLWEAVQGPSLDIKNPTQFGVLAFVIDRRFKELRKGGSFDDYGGIDYLQTLEPGPDKQP